MYGIILYSLYSPNNLHIALILLDDKYLNSFGGILLGPPLFLAPNMDHNSFFVMTLFISSAMILCALFI